MPIEDVKKAFDALNGKLSAYETLFAYADGDQPTVYSSTRLREAFDNLNAKFTENWCSVIVNATLDRLGLAGWNAEDKAVNVALDQLWQKLELELEAHDVHNGALICHEAFIIAQNVNGQVEAYYNDPRLCHLFYDPEQPRKKLFAAKWWNTGASYRMTLYYPDRTEYYATRSKTKPSSANAFQQMEPFSSPNPYGQVPVFHFRGKGELDNVITLQDAVNKLLADMMISAEFGAFKQRWIISNSDTSTLKNAPNEIWEIPAGDGQGQQTSVGQFDETPLSNYLSAMDKLSGAMAIISRTPKHYFYDAGSNLSGEALIAMESPLTKKVELYQKQFGQTWRELAAYLLLLSGRGTVDPTTITPTWRPAESTQPYTEALTVKTMTESGIPLVTALRWRGKSSSEIDQMVKDEGDQKKKNARMAPILLEEARARDSQSNDNPLTGGNDDEGDNENE